MDEFAGLKKISEQFQIDGEAEKIEHYGKGFINRTFRVTTKSRRYILQRINTSIFADADSLMRNICIATEFLRTKGRETLNVVFAKTGEPYLRVPCGDESGCWRVYDFVEGAVCHESATQADFLAKAGSAFGDFLNCFADFDATRLSETIAHFHDTPKRFEDFRKAVLRDEIGRAKFCRAEIDAFFSRAETFGKITDGLKKGEIPLRVVHNDTKLNNILFDEKTGNARAIVDLDTLMPGSLLFDFGDFIRFAGNTAAEDESDLDKVHFSQENFCAFASGFLPAVKENLSLAEEALLPYSCYLLAMENGMRFLADYLSGDTYYATKYPEHNLVRARVQLKHALEMDSKSGEMAQAVQKILKK